MVYVYYYGMEIFSDMNDDFQDSETPTAGRALEPFASPVINRIQAGKQGSPGCWPLPGGELVLPSVFGFCRGVKRALVIADKAVAAHAQRTGGEEIVLLGELIHNPWVNDYFRDQGVRILSTQQRDDVEKYLEPRNVAIIPAFGVPLPIERRLAEIGCETIDCSCGDVIRLWHWSSQEVKEGFGLLIFGRAMHDETVVTKSRLAAVGGKYLVVENLHQVKQFADMITAKAPISPEVFQKTFGTDATNAASIEPLLKLAQASQTTMLYDDTQQVREILTAAFRERFGENFEQRLRFHPTVCRATQDRQNAAVELCKSGCDLVIVVGGFGSSNTRHLHELARQYAPAYLIENAQAIVSANKLTTWSMETKDAEAVHDWLPEKRPLRIGVLAGASSPEIVIGQVLQRLAVFLE